MRLFPDDRRFEEAGRNPELCDKLLRDLQRSRKSIVFQIIFVGVVLLAAIGWLLMKLRQCLATPSIPLPHWLEVLMTDKSTFLIAAGLVAGPMLFFFGQSFVLLMNQDTRIKMLLFLRAQQNRPS
jgi:hypothetical protein